MDVKKIQRAKLNRVEIRYSYDNNEWANIRVEFESGECVQVEREQVEAFLRIGKVYQDLVAAQALRDNLLKIFGVAPIVPPP